MRRSRGPATAHKQITTQYCRCALRPHGTRREAGDRRDTRPAARPECAHPPAGTHTRRYPLAAIGCPALTGSAPAAPLESQCGKNALAFPSRLSCSPDTRTSTSAPWRSNKRNGGARTCDVPKLLHLQTCANTGLLRDARFNSYLDFC